MKMAVLTPVVGAKLNVEDRHFDDAHGTSVRQESDFAPYKPACDVIVNATACAPRAQAGAAFQVRVCVRVVMPPWEPNNKTAIREWEEISKSYAEQACGTARGVIGKDMRPGNIWETRELGALMGNENISQIDTIDQKYYAVKNIFRRK